jgi:hypothetical protein
MDPAVVTDEREPHSIPSSLTVVAELAAQFPFAPS